MYRGAGIPDRYQSVARQIERLEKAGDADVLRRRAPVLRSEGRQDGDAGLRRRPAPRHGVARPQARRLPFDPERSVIVVVAIENHQVAVHTGTRDSVELGLRGDAIVRDLIEPSKFYDLAKAGQYPEAISALLDTTDRWIASHDATTRRPVAQVGVPAPVVSGGGTSASAWRPGWALSLLVVVSAVIGLLWMLHRRARGRLDQRIKEVRSHATDVMDRLDALKERLKLLPAMDADFKTPMTGETAALYAAVQADVGRLWDRWLSVMDTLDRAQKLALGITSPFKRKALQRRRGAAGPEGALRGDRRGCPGLRRRVWTGSTRHTSRREQSWRRSARRSRSSTRKSRRSASAALPIAPYQEELAAITTETDRAARAHHGRPDRRPVALEAPQGPRRKALRPRGAGRWSCSRRCRSSPRRSRGCVARWSSIGRRDSGSTRRAATRINRSRRPIRRTPRRSRPSAPAIPTRRRTGWRRPGRWSSRPRARSSRSSAHATIAVASSRARASDRAAPRGPAAGGGRSGPAGAGIRPVLVRGRGARTWSRSATCWRRSTGMAADAADAASDASQRYLAAAGLAPPARPAAAGRAPADVGTGRSL